MRIDLLTVESTTQLFLQQVWCGGPLRTPTLDLNDDKTVTRQGNTGRTPKSTQLSIHVTERAAGDCSEGRGKADQVSL